MKATYSLFLLILCSSLLLCPGCKRQSQNQAQAASITSWHEGALKIAASSKAPKTIYVDAAGHMRSAPNLAEQLGRALAKGSFRLADAPSKAGYILHVNIVDEGDVAPEALKAAVRAGYGSKTIFQGSGARAVLVDALMVQRKVPKAPRPSRERMQNASSRNAIGSSQMRLAVMATGGPHGAEYKEGDYTESVGRAIASELAQSLETGK